MRRLGTTPRQTAPVTTTPFRVGEANFACAYAVDIAADDDRTSEEWAREAWEGAPAPMRWFMVLGWRFVLGLRLGPRGSMDHILGWRIVASRPDATACELRSRFLQAYNTFVKDSGRLVWSTLVFYERLSARLIWPPVSLLHRPLVRMALRRARAAPPHLPDGR
ncbi:MAG TPA: DUF2867 domain-containing protein [Acidimicrobiales bacterium]|nr:DUF2867 domain-containing protein [Acidimicrobiales bacterium]